MAAAGGVRFSWRRFLRIHLPLAAVLLIYMLVIGCPFYRLCGIPCPGCGLSRAHLAAFRLDFAQALYFHPLFWTILPTAVYYAHRRVCGWPQSRRFDRVFLAALAGAFLVVYVYRLVFDPSAAIAIDWDGSLLGRAVAALCRWWG